MFGLATTFGEAVEAFEKLSEVGNPEFDSVNCKKLFSFVSTANDVKEIAQILQKPDCQERFRPVLGLFYKLFCHFFTAEELLEFHFSIAPNYHSCLGTAIASYRRKGRLSDCFRLVLGFPHLPASTKVLREQPDLGIEYFHELYKRGFEPYNASYALGILYYEARNIAGALQWLNIAKGRTKTQKRIQHIEHMLGEVTAYGV